MNHKRGRPKHQRMGCFCKYWKDEREAKAGKYTVSDRKRMLDDDGNVTMETAAALVASEPIDAEPIAVDDDRIWMDWLTEREWFE